MFMKEILFREDREIAASVIKADRMGTFRAVQSRGRGLDPGCQVFHFLCN